MSQRDADVNEATDAVTATTAPPRAVSFTPSSPTATRLGVQTPRRRPFATAISWIALLVAAAVVFELSCRVEDWVMYRTPIASPYQSIEDLVIRDADGMHGRPNAQFQEWIMNGLGTRGPSASLLPPKNTTRVITVGASETFGLRESPDHEYPRQLEDSLNARLRALGCSSENGRFEVLNAAFAGMSLPTTDQDLRNRLVRYRPSIVVAYPSPAAYLGGPLPTATPPDSSADPNRVSLAAVLRPRALERVRNQLKLMIPSVIQTWLRRREINNYNSRRTHDATWLFQGVPADRVAAYDADLRHLVGTIRSIGATPVLATHANAFNGRRNIDTDKLTAWQKTWPRASGTTLVAFDSVAGLVTEKVGADSGVVVVDAATKLAGAPDSAFADAVHFTDLGATLMASTFAEGVMRAHQTKPCATP